MNSDSDKAISILWNKLLESPQDTHDYILDALMLTPLDTRRKIVDGKQQKAVQLFSIKSSILTNADPEKKGLTTLSMRAIHYWKTLYERALQDPEMIEEKRDKYVPRVMYEGVRNNLHEEIEMLQDEITKIMDDNNMVPKEELISANSEICSLNRKYDNIKKEMEEKKESDQKFYDKLLEQQDARHQKELDYWKKRCSDMAKGITKFPEAPLDDEH